VPLRCRYTMQGRLPTPTVMAVDFTGESISESPSPSEISLLPISPLTSPPSEISFSPDSLPDTEFWDNSPDSPALLDVLDRPTSPADISTEDRDEEGAHLTLRGDDEKFMLYALDNFFEHANVDSEHDIAHLDVLRARFSTELSLKVGLEARVLRWFYQVGSWPCSL